MKDEDGRVAEWLDLAYPHKKQNMVERIYKKNPIVKAHHENFTAETKKILNETEVNEFSLKGLKPKDKEKKMRSMKYTNAKLKNYAAHAGFLNVSGEGAGVFKTGFINLPGSLGNKNTFPGVRLMDEKVKQGFEDFSPSTLKTTKKWRPEMSLGNYQVADTHAFMSEIKNRYAESGIPLTDVVENRIREHIKDNNNILPKMAGIAGLHAEVQALNSIVSMSGAGENMSGKLSSSYIYTQRLTGAKNEDFPACHNCSGIISGLENVMTGRVKNHTRLTRRNSVA
ncbi:YwqJ-related putative deaminase, partial [Morganella psychrotolerans]|uniref:YwqJ-related putative deaminase n=1 Tax=Morganella psychrotolerans TaxID=368603 RepID=UPI0039B00020